MNSKLLMFIAFLLGFTYVAANASLAIFRPRVWLRSWWTARRGLDADREIDDSEIRWRGGVFAAIAALAGWMLIKVGLTALG